MSDNQVLSFKKILKIHLERMSLQALFGRENKVKIIKSRGENYRQVTDYLTHFLPALFHTFLGFHLNNIHDFKIQTRRSF